MTTTEAPAERRSKARTPADRSVWRQRACPEGAVVSLAARFGLLPETARLLAQRGLTDPAAVEAFLNPSFANLIPPENLMNMSRAIDRILESIKRREKLMIHGDYDVDGVTSTALLYRFFAHIGMKPDIYIPNRLEENHGLNDGAVQMARDNGIKLFITCDCGVSSAAQVSDLAASGIDVIVTDHHLVPEEGPPKDAIVINPSQDDCAFGDVGMSGVGLAYYLVIGLRKRLREEGFFKDGITEPNLKEYLDLVTLGTIADQAPLLGQNRIFVRSGLPQLNATTKTGLRVLMNLCVAADRTVGVQEVAFNIAPKLNAAGRLGNAQEAFELLIEEDPVRAAVLARKLLNYNDERRRIEERHFREALNQVEELYGGKTLPGGVVLYRPDWHLGVLGLVAQKVTQKLRCPTILLSKQGERLKGSGRSIGDLSLIDALRACAMHLKTYGGHKMAAGVSVTEENLQLFRDGFGAHLSGLPRPAEADFQFMDGPLGFDSVSDRLLQELEQLRPFGEGNPEPLFMCDAVSATDLRKMGDQKQHLRMQLMDSEGRRVSAVGFSMGEYAKYVERSWSVLATPEYNLWQGKRSIQLRLRAIYPL